jgi:hypothetical protein
MAVAMEVAWRGVELGGSSGSGSSSSSAVSKKRAWGADTEKLMHLMMGQFGAVRPAEVTLDLLGAASAPCPTRELDSPEFLELDPDQPLPSGWEKCLDLKVLARLSFSSNVGWIFAGEIFGCEHLGIGVDGDLGFLLLCRRGRFTL